MCDYTYVVITHMIIHVELIYGYNITWKSRF